MRNLLKENPDIIQYGNSVHSHADGEARSFCPFPNNTFLIGRYNNILHGNIIKNMLSNFLDVDSAEKQLEEYKSVDKARYQSLFYLLKSITVYKKELFKNVAFGGDYNMLKTISDEIFNMFLEDVGNNLVKYSNPSSRSFVVEKLSKRITMQE